VPQFDSQVIAISSFKPFEKSLEVAENQLAAKASWEPLFETIIYFGPPEERLGSRKTLFIDQGDYPSIKRLMEAAADWEGWSCLINADIYLSAKFLAVELALDAVGAKFALSKRYQMIPGVPLDQASVVDWGLDIFIARPELWEQAARAVPPEFRIGHNLWDTWTVAFMMQASGGAAVDLTPSRLVFHPQHGARERPYPVEKPAGDPYIDHVKWPSRALKI
jgi:hypothetical protein